MTCEVRPNRQEAGTRSALSRCHPCSRRERLRDVLGFCRRRLLAEGLLLALVHDIEGLLWFSALILGAARARDLLRRRSVRRAVDGTTGTVLIGFGLRLGLGR